MATPGDGSRDVSRREFYKCSAGVNPPAGLRPADVCRGLLSALDVSKGRRKQRARDTAADATGLRIKRGLLEAAVRADPDPIVFEAWLLCRCFESPPEIPVGAAHAMAREIFAEWQLAASSPSVPARLDELAG